MRLNDPALVRREYASEEGLAARALVYGRGHTGPDAHVAVLAAVSEASPSRVLEIGCGRGELAERMACDLGADVVALDQSERMVELARGRGVRAVVAGAEELPFGNAEFDCAVAAWVLYHVADVDGALAEVVRVLRPRGRLVAATNGADHMRELWRLVGRDRSAEVPVFRGDNGEEILRRHFPTVERREIRGTALFADRNAVRAYVAASIGHRHLADRVPDLPDPLHATRSVVVFVAEKRA